MPSSALFATSNVMSSVLVKTLPLKYLSTTPSKRFGVSAETPKAKKLDTKKIETNRIIFFIMLLPLFLSTLQFLSCAETLKNKTSFLVFLSVSAHDKYFTVFIMRRNA